MPKKNAFFYFMLDYKQRKAAEGQKIAKLSDVVPCASKIWERMDAAEREPYIQQANKEHGKANRNKPNISGQGLSAADKLHAKKARAVMINEFVYEWVNNADINNELTMRVFYVISLSHFGCTLQCAYIPAELGIVKCSLQSGVMERMHMHIHLDEIPLGAALSVQTHTKATHNLPLPPNALGIPFGEEVAQCLLNFLAEEEEIPLLFTNDLALPIVEGMLHKLLGHHINDKALYVCPLSALFSNLIEATEQHSKIGSTIPDSLSAQYILQMDCYEFSEGISCDYHEQQDDSFVYCVLSQVTRWAYIIFKYCCPHMAIEPILGKHMPGLSKELMDDFTIYECKLNEKPHTTVSASGSSLNERILKVKALVQPITSDTSVEMQQKKEDISCAVDQTKAQGKEELLLDGIRELSVSKDEEHTGSQNTPKYVSLKDVKRMLKAKALVKPSTSDTFVETQQKKEDIPCAVDQTKAQGKEELLLDGIRELSVSKDEEHTPNTDKFRNTNTKLKIRALFKKSTSHTSVEMQPNKEDISCTVVQTKTQGKEELLLDGIRELSVSKDEEHTGSQNTPNSVNDKAASGFCGEEKLGDGLDTIIPLSMRSAYSSQYRRTMSRLGPNFERLGSYSRRGRLNQ
uniref:HMG box domain-containing protein n=1 Tax=Anopheles minimus TaxID=112268 RepID=A0A182W4I3_9DIPT